MVELKGLATTMAALGYADTEIMAIGRWKSEVRLNFNVHIIGNTIWQAFLKYVKSARVKRCKVARELAARILSKQN